jgi:hypothetical protein
MTDPEETASRRPMNSVSYQVLILNLIQDDILCKAWSGATIRVRKRQF